MISQISSHVSRIIPIQMVPTTWKHHCKTKLDQTVFFLCGESPRFFTAVPFSPMPVIISQLSLLYQLSWIISNIIISIIMNYLKHLWMSRFYIEGQPIRLRLLSKDRQSLLKLISFDFLVVCMQVRRLSYSWNFHHLFWVDFAEFWFISANNNKPFHERMTDDRMVIMTLCGRRLHLNDAVVGALASTNQLVCIIIFNIRRPTSG